MLTAALIVALALLLQPVAGMLAQAWLGRLLFPPQALDLPPLPDPEVMAEKMGRGLRRGLDQSDGEGAEPWQGP